MAAATEQFPNRLPQHFASEIPQRCPDPREDGRVEPHAGPEIRAECHGLAKGVDASLKNVHSN